MVRRNGKPFISGNSGFPKSMNIGLAIDKKNGIESINTGVVSPNARPNCDKSNTLYESGIVGKNFNIKKAANEWNGWGTSLKPSYEPIIVARKPVEKSIVENVMKYGVGGINIDECRVPFICDNDIEEYAFNNSCNERTLLKDGDNLGAYDGGWKVDKTKREVPQGRFPANTILTYDETDEEEVCSGFPNTKSTGGSGEASKKNTFSNTYNGGWGHDLDCSHLGGLGDSGSASRYFYCAKASKRDRDEGLDDFEEKKMYGDDMQWGYGNANGDNFGDRVANVTRKNTHPTVKPVSLMQYLVRLVTPKGGTILDPFNGSGSTGKAVMYENKDRNADYKYIGIELTDEYLPIAKARIEYACNDNSALEISKPIRKENKLIVEENKYKKVSLFDDTVN